MINLDKLHIKHIEALLETNKALPESITKHIVIENNQFQFCMKTQNSYKDDPYRYDERARSILQGMLKAKRKLFNDTSEKTWLFKPKGKSALMAAYDAAAKSALKNDGEFTQAARNGRIDADKLKSVLAGNIGVHKDLDIAVLQSIELSYLKEEPFPKVLGERMKELGIISKKQVPLVSDAAKDYENSVKAAEAKRMAEADAAHQAIIAKCNAEDERRFAEMFGIKPHKPNNTVNTTKPTNKHSPKDDDDDELVMEIGERPLFSSNASRDHYWLDKEKERLAREEREQQRQQEESNRQLGQDVINQQIQQDEITMQQNVASDFLRQQTEQLHRDEMERTERTIKELWGDQIHHERHGPERDDGLER